MFIQQHYVLCTRYVLMSADVTQVVLWLIDNYYNYVQLADRNIDLCAKKNNI